MVLSVKWTLRSTSLTLLLACSLDVGVFGSPVPQWRSFLRQGVASPLINNMNMNRQLKPKSGKPGGEPEGIFGPGLMGVMSSGQNSFKDAFQMVPKPNADQGKNGNGTSGTPADLPSTVANTFSSLPIPGGSAVKEAGQSNPGELAGSLGEGASKLIRGESQPTDDGKKSSPAETMAGIVSPGTKAVTDRMGQFAPKGIASDPSSVFQQATEAVSPQGFSSMLSTDRAKEFTNGLSEGVPKGLFPEGLTRSMSEGVSNGLAPESLNNATADRSSKSVMDQLSQGFASPMRSGLGDGVPQSLTDALPEGVSKPMSSGLPDGFPKSISEALPEGISKPMSSGIPEGISKSLTDALPEGLSKPMSSGIPDSMPNSFTDAIPEGISKPMSSGLPDGVPQSFNEVLPEAISKPMSSGLSDGIPSSLTEVLPEGVSKQMGSGIPDGLPKSISEGMPDSVSKTFSDQLSQGLPDGVQKSMGEAVPKDVPKSLTDAFSSMSGAGKPQSFGQNLNEANPFKDSGSIGEAIQESAGTSAVGSLVADSPKTISENLRNAPKSMSQTVNSASDSPTALASNLMSSSMSMSEGLDKYFSPSRTASAASSGNSRLLSFLEKSGRRKKRYAQNGDVESSRQLADFSLALSANPYFQTVRRQGMDVGGLFAAVERNLTY